MSALPQGVIEERINSVAEPVNIDESKLQSLLSMGFSKESCEVALFRHNNSLENAASFLIETGDDSEIMSQFIGELNAIRARNRVANARVDRPDGKRSIFGSFLKPNKPPRVKNSLPIGRINRETSSSSIVVDEPTVSNFFESPVERNNDICVASAPPDFSESIVDAPQPIPLMEPSLSRPSVAKVPERPTIISFQSIFDLSANDSIEPVQSIPLSNSWSGMYGDNNGDHMSQDHPISSFLPTTNTSYLNSLSSDNQTDELISVEPERDQNDAIDVVCPSNQQVALEDENNISSAMSTTSNTSSEIVSSDVVSNLDEGVVFSSVSDETLEPSTICNDSSMPDETLENEVVVNAHSNVLEQNNDVKESDKVITIEPNIAELSEGGKAKLSPAMGSGYGFFPLLSGGFLGRKSVFIPQEAHRVKDSSDYQDIDEIVNLSSPIREIPVSPCDVPSKIDVTEESVQSNVDEILTKSQNLSSETNSSSLENTIKDPTWLVEDEEGSDSESEFGSIHSDIDSFPNERDSESGTFGVGYVTEHSIHLPESRSVSSTVMHDSPSEVPNFFEKQYNEIDASVNQQNPVISFDVNELNEIEQLQLWNESSNESTYYDQGFLPGTSNGISSDSGFSPLDLTVFDKTSDSNPNIHLNNDISFDNNFSIPDNSMSFISGEEDSSYVVPEISPEVYLYGGNDHVISNSESLPSNVISTAPSTDGYVSSPVSPLESRFSSRNRMTTDVTPSSKPASTKIDVPQAVPINCEAYAHLAESIPDVAPLLVNVLLPIGPNRVNFGVEQERSDLNNELDPDSFLTIAAPLPMSQEEINALEEQERRTHQAKRIERENFQRERDSLISSLSRAMKGEYLDEVNRIMKPSHLRPRIESTEDEVLRRARERFRKRTSLPFQITDAQGLWNVTLSLKQPNLPIHKSPQGSRSNNLVIQGFQSRMLAQKYAESFCPPKWAGSQDPQHCVICTHSFALLLKGHHCRNCGQLICKNCSSKSWPSSMVPFTYHNNEKVVRVCDNCHYIAEAFADALRVGDFPRVQAIFATGNVNLRCPYDIYACGNYPIHFAAQGGNLDVFRWLVESNRCPLRNPDGKSVDNKQGLGSLAIAAKFGRVEIMKYLVQTWKTPVIEIGDLSILHNGLFAALGGEGDLPHNNDRYLKSTLLSSLGLSKGKEKVVTESVTVENLPSLLEQESPVLALNESSATPALDIAVTNEIPRARYIVGHPRAGAFVNAGVATLLPSAGDIGSNSEPSSSKASTVVIQNSKVVRPQWNPRLKKNFDRHAAKAQKGSLARNSVMLSSTVAETIIRSLGSPDSSSISRSPSVVGISSRNDVSLGDADNQSVSSENSTSTTSTNVNRSRDTVESSYRRPICVPYEERDFSSLENDPYYSRFLGNEQRSSVSRGIAEEEQDNRMPRSSNLIFSNDSYVGSMMDRYQSSWNPSSVSMNPSPVSSVISSPSITSSAPRDGRNTNPFAPTVVSRVSSASELRSMGDSRDRSSNVGVSIPTMSSSESLQPTYYTPTVVSNLPTSSRSTTATSSATNSYAVNSSSSLSTSASTSSPRFIASPTIAILPNQSTPLASVGVTSSTSSSSTASVSIEDMIPPPPAYDIVASLPSVPSTIPTIASSSSLSSSSSSSRSFHRVALP